ncbi:hypothetical protein GBA52_024668 [Prunus armeniaca]|nr:hypothetical protein GBA52_024668 [Prunus armeniaca]
MKLSNCPYCSYLFQTITCSILVIPSSNFPSVIPLGFSRVVLSLQLASSSLCKLFAFLNPSKLPSQPKTPQTQLLILQTQKILRSSQNNPNPSFTLRHIHSHKKPNTQIPHQLSPPQKKTKPTTSFPTKTQPNITIPLFTSIEQRERSSTSQASSPNPNANSRPWTSQAPRSQ